MKTFKWTEEEFEKVASYMYKLMTSGSEKKHLTEGNVRGVIKGNQNPDTQHQLRSELLKEAEATGNMSVELLKINSCLYSTYPHVSNVTSPISRGYP